MLVQEGARGVGVVEMVVTATSLWHRAHAHRTRNPARRQKGQGQLLVRFRFGSICSAHSVPPQRTRVKCYWSRSCLFVCAQTCADWLVAAACPVDVAIALWAEARVSLALLAGWRWDVVVSVAVIVSFQTRKQMGHSTKPGGDRKHTPRSNGATRFFFSSRSTCLT